MTTIEIYRIDVENQVLERIDIIETYQGLSWYEALDDVGGCQFNLNVFDTKASKENLIRYRNQVCVKEDGVVKFFGPMVKFQDQFEGINGVVNIQASSYLYHFTDRYTDKLQQYVNAEQCDIAWDLISVTQNRVNGGLCVVEGTTPASITRNIDFERKTISKALTDMSAETDGFDFSFDPSVDANGIVDSIVFNCTYPRLGTYRTDLPALQSGVNVKRWGRTTIGELLNSGTAEGSGTGDPIFAEEELEASQEGYTRRELILSEKDISVQEQLEQKLSSVLNIQSVEGYDVNVELMPEQRPTFEDINLGDTLDVDLRVPDGGTYMSLQGQARVIQKATGVDINGVKYNIPKLRMIGV